MSNKISFPGFTHAVGTATPSACLNASLAAAERSGIPRDRLDALMAHDRLLATYMLRLLGSEDEQEQRLGEGGLSRLMSIMEDAAGAPQPLPIARWNSRSGPRRRGLLVGLIDAPAAVCVQESLQRWQTLR